MAKRGFTITPQRAEECIAAHVAALPAQTRPLLACVGHVLRQDVEPERDNPPFDRVCMDGIAVNSQVLERGVRTFRIAAMQAAGTPPLALSRPEDAIEVMTGAMLPAGTDCIIPLEEYDAADGVVSLKPGVTGKAYRNVQRRGEDSPRGVPMLRAGTLLRAPEIAVVASAGLAQVEVSRQPRIAVLSTGDELIEPGEPIAEHQVRRSNAYALLAALRQRGLEHVASDHLLDDEQVLRERLSLHLSERDVLIVSGGVSGGRLDLVPRVLKSVGVREVFHRVAQRPGVPMWFGTAASGQAVFGLPGNPVATLVCMRRYVIPALGSMMGVSRVPGEPVALAAPVDPHPSLTCFLPVAVHRDETGRSWAQPCRPSGSGDFLALTRADGFIELPPQQDAFPEGFVTGLYRW